MPVPLSPATLTGQSSLVSTAADGYAPFFDNLLAIVRDRPIDRKLGQAIESYVLEWLAEHPLNEFTDYSEASYVRTYLGRCPETRWEAILMSWQAGNTTAVHAHPQFAGYHFADGVFRVEIFEPDEKNGIRPTDTLVIDKPAALFAIGHPGAFDNHIHRITCLSDTGHSLHVYSDDALKGAVYRPAH